MHVYSLLTAVTAGFSLVAFNPVLAGLAEVQGAKLHPLVGHGREYHDGRGPDNWTRHRSHRLRGGRNCTRSFKTADSSKVITKTSASAVVPTQAVKGATLIAVGGSGGEASVSRTRRSRSTLSATMKSTISAAAATTTIAVRTTIKAPTAPTTARTTTTRTTAARTTAATSKAVIRTTTTTRRTTTTTTRPITTTTSARATTTTASAPSSLSTVQTEALASHNNLRAVHGAQDVAWNASLAATAADWASKCVFEHGGHNGVGQNLAAAGGSGASAGTAGQIKMWSDEEPEYNASNPVASHYTQMVWKSTTAIGCAMQRCDNIFTPAFSPSYFLVCHYYPPGNVYPAQYFTANVQ